VKYLGLGVLILLDGIFWTAFGVLKESEKTNADLNIIKQRSLQEKCVLASEF
jgi:hypothetical protein